MAQNEKKKAKRRATWRKAFGTLLAIGALSMLFRQFSPLARSTFFARQPDEATAKDGDLVRVVDGDTLDLRVEGRVERVRLLRINTPERKQPGYGEATLHLEQLLKGCQPSLELEKADQERRDRYGRLLAYVNCAGKNLNVEMVRGGWSRFWTKYGEGRLAEEFRAAEIEARRKGLGLWVGGQFETKGRS